MPPRTTLNPKQVVVRRFMDILAAAGIYLHPQSGHRYIKWTFFPEHIWERGVYVVLPREIIFETADETVEHRIRTPLRSPWTEETVRIMRNALDAGKVKVLPRPPDRPIVFEVFDQNGVSVDIPRFARSERSRRRGKESESTSAVQSDSQEDDDEQEDEEEYSAEPEDQPAYQSSVREIYGFLRHLYRNHNLDISSVRDEWKELPRLLARRKLYMVGLPAICAPYVVDDEVNDATTPAKWTASQCDKFLFASRAGVIKLVRRDSNFLVLFQLANEDGSIHNTLLQYSPSWIQKNMQASITNNEMLWSRQRRNPRDSEKPSKVPLNATVTSSGRGWIVVEESTDEDEEALAADNPKEQRKRLRTEMSTRVQKQIVDFDIRGDGTEVTWNTLPLALAESNKYITGIPAGGLPKIKDDKVVFQACHPSLWSHEVIRQMQDNVLADKFKVLQRPPGRIVLFEVEDGSTKYDTTLNFSNDWLAVHMDDPSLKDKKKAALARQEEKKVRPPLVTAASKDKDEYKKPRPPAPPKKASNGERTKRLEERAQFLEDSQKGAANAKAVMGMLGFGPSIQTIKTSTKAKGSNGSGTSTPRSDPSVSTHPKQSASISEPPTPILPAVHPRRALKTKQRVSFSNGGNGSGNYSYLTRTDSVDDVKITMSPQSLSARLDSPVVTSFDPNDIWKFVDVKSNTWPPPGYPKHVGPDVSRTDLSEMLVAFFKRHAFASRPEVSVWLQLPEILAERRQFLHGVPFICALVVKDDQADIRSNPAQWTSEMANALNWAITSNTLSVRTREAGRRVLFEIIGPDGNLYDSTLGYSDKWLDNLLPDTAGATAFTVPKVRTPLPPIVTSKRTHSEANSPNGMDIDRDPKRRKTGEEDWQPYTPYDDTPKLNGRRFSISFAGTQSPGGFIEGLEEVTTDPKDLSLERLIPRNLPAPMSKGKVFLRFGPVDQMKEEVDEIPGLFEEDGEETWEWIPPEQEKTALRVSTFWNPTQARWRVVGEERSLEHLGAMKGVSGRATIPNPDKVGGNILRRGQCHFNDSRGQWEIDFGERYREREWIIRWNTEFGKWEWVWGKNWK